MKINVGFFPFTRTPRRNLFLSVVLDKETNWFSFEPEAQQQVYFRHSRVPHRTRVLALISWEKKMSIFSSSRHPERHVSRANFAQRRQKSNADISISSIYSIRWRNVLHTISKFTHPYHTRERNKELWAFHTRSWVPALINTRQQNDGLLYYRTSVVREYLSLNPHTVYPTNPKTNRKTSFYLPHQIRLFRPKRKGLNEYARWQIAYTSSFVFFGINVFVRKI